MTGVSPRSRARAWALQLLYGWEMTGESSLGEYARQSFLRRRVSERYRAYVDRLLGVLEERLPEIDRILGASIPNWRLDRLAAIDRNILRIGVAELRYVDDVPAKVAIHEAIRLAERYGSDESSRFVNGVLDAVFRKSKP